MKNFLKMLINNQTNSIDKKKKIEGILIIIIILISVFLMINASYIVSIYYPMDFDGGWNATVAKNFMESNKYMVTYYNNQLFEPKISTGEPQILLTALLYKLFGINHLTTILTSLIGGILLYYSLIKLYIKNLNNKLLFVISVTLLLFTNSTFYICLTHNYGELLGVAFLVLSCVLLNAKKYRKAGYFIAGGLLICSIFTKVVMLFASLSLVALVIFEAIYYKNAKVKEIILFIMGILLFLGGFFLFRLSQFNFNFKETIESFEKYIMEMLSQSKINYEDKEIVLTIFDKIYNISFMSLGGVPSLLYVFFPTFIYLLYLVKRKKIDNGFLDVNVLKIALCSSSIYVYYLLFGTEAYNNKRLLPYQIILSVFYIYLIIKMIDMAFNNFYQCEKIKKYITYFRFSSIILLLIILLNINIKNLQVAYIYFNYNEISKERKYENKLISVVKNLKKENALYLTYGANVNILELLLNIKQKDILKDFEYWQNQNDNKEIYLVTGNVMHNNNEFDLVGYLMSYGYKLVKISKYELDYDEIDTRYKSSFLDMYSVYQIVKIF